MKRGPMLLSTSLALVLVLTGCGLTPPALTPSTDAGGSSRSPAASRSPIPLPSVALPGRITVQEITAHIEALEAIADAHGGVRAAGTPGYEASVEYVVGQLRALGYEVATPEVEIDAFRELPGGTVAVTEGGPTFAAGRDFNAMIYSSGAEVRATVAGVGFPDSPDGAGQQGCSEDDWEEFPSGSIAVTPAGPCLRRQGVSHAVQAGAVALVVSYADRDAGEVLRPTLLSPDGMEIPALSASAEMGEVLLEAAEDGTPVSVQVETEIRPATVRNVVADSPAGRDGRVAMLGAHLDSILDGPGINDNVSGVAALLEIARLLAEDGTDAGGAVRLGFWAAEEFGLLGSTAYVQDLAPREREAIAAYLNLDMLGSVNGVPFVYGSRFAPAGSERISEFLGAWLEAEGIGFEALDVGGGSDHLPFAQAGIPIGGIFSGGSEPKGRRQALEFGGEAGEPYDPCYHLACDTAANVDAERVADYAEAAAATIMVLASGELLRGDAGG